jgi:hypothetical protein
MDDAYLEPESITLRQAEALRRLLPEGSNVSHLSRYEAAGLIKLLDPDARWRLLPPSERQKAFLTKYDLWQDGLTRGEAADLIDQALERERQEPGCLQREKECRQQIREWELLSNQSTPK